MEYAIKLRTAGLALFAAAALGGTTGHAAPDTLRAEQAHVRLRQLADERGRVWVLTHAGVAIFEPGSLRLIRRVRLPGWAWAGEPYGCQPDLALGPSGEAVISSDVVPTLWRIDPGSFEVSEHALALASDLDRDIGFSELWYSRERNAYFGLSAIHGSAWQIDLQLRTARKLAPHALPARVFRAGATQKCGRSARSAIR